MFLHEGDEHVDRADDSGLRRNGELKALRPPAHFPQIAATLY